MDELNKGKSVLFYNLLPKTTWKEITLKILQKVPHDEIIVHITLPVSGFYQLPFIKIWLKSNFPKISNIIWSFNKRSEGESRGFRALQKNIDLSKCSILTYAHSKGSSRKRKNNPPIQDWTEFMRYFVVEQLDLSKNAFNKGFWLTGVNLQRASRKKYPENLWHYSGNFVSVNLHKTRELFISSECKKDYYGVEMFWGTWCNKEKMYELYNSNVDHYNNQFSGNVYRK